MHTTKLSICTGPSPAVTSKLWPGSEDKALRGRNLSAVSRTLYRQEGEALAGLPSCVAKSWRAENQSDKSTLKNTQGAPLPQNNFPIKTKSHYEQNSRNRLSIFSGQVQPPISETIDYRPRPCLGPSTINSPPSTAPRLFKAIQDESK